MFSTHDIFTFLISVLFQSIDRVTPMAHRIYPSQARESDRTTPGRRRSLLLRPALSGSTRVEPAQGRGRVAPLSLLCLRQDAPGIKGETAGRSRGRPTAGRKRRCGHLP